MIIGAAVCPTAPLLVDGVSPTLPEGVDRVCDAIDAMLDRLPPFDVAVLVAAAGPSPDGSAQGLYDAANATLASVGRPDIVHSTAVDRELVEAITHVTQYPMYRGDDLPQNLSVLALLLGGTVPVVPITVPAGASFDALVSVGAGIAGAVDDDRRVLVVAAGDLSAGHTDRSPLSQISGARDFDDQVVDAVDSGRLDGLGRLGPAEAKRVGALGWASLAVLHGAVARAKIGMVVRHYSAPRGVGYLVASGA